MTSEPASDRHARRVRDAAPAVLIATMVGLAIALPAATPTAAPPDAGASDPPGVASASDAPGLAASRDPLTGIRDALGQRATVPPSTQGRQFGAELLFADVPPDWAPRERGFVDVLLAAARSHGRLLPPRPERAAEAGRGRLARIVTRPHVPDTRQLEHLFDSAEYRLDVPAEALTIPRVVLERLPGDLVDEASVERRKSVFLRTVLPAVLVVNEEIERDRARLHRLHALIDAREPIDDADRLWLDGLGASYGVEDGDWRTLLRRVDVIPPSLALAQAAKESGWGTSRFARLGNALFGQWAWSRDAGLVPRRRGQGETHVVRSFDSILDSARAYALNLNTHEAYGAMRSMRAERRAAAQPLDGHTLAACLERYSERGARYIEGLRTIMRVNELARLDAARLRPADDALSTATMATIPPLPIETDMRFVVGSAI